MLQAGLRLKMDIHGNVLMIWKTVDKIVVFLTGYCSARPGNNDLL